MEYNSFIVKYAEIGIKGKNRYRFEDALVSRIKRVIRNLGEFNVNKSQSRIYIHAKSSFDYDKLIETLKHVFGIASISPVWQAKKSNYQSLSKEVISYLKSAYDKNTNYTFKVKAKRLDKKFELTSDDINREAGHDILEEFPNFKVDVHKPDITVHIEIREEINIYSIVIDGPGGMPYGTNGKAMLLLSGGIDSPVAGIMIAKRGVLLDACYFHAPPYTSDRAKQKVIDLALLMSKWTGPICLNVINFTDIQLAIYEKCPHDELTIIMRRYMMKIAQRIAMEDDCLGLVTGESIGQVASQTMASMFSTNEVCNMPVYRPLVGFDKVEIINRANEYGTFETSILPYEDCCTIFVAKHPVTKPSLNIIKKSETALSSIDEEMIEKAVQSREKIMLDTYA